MITLLSAVAMAQTCFTDGMTWKMRVYSTEASMPKVTNVTDVLEDTEQVDGYTAYTSRVISVSE